MAIKPEDKVPMFVWEATLLKEAINKWGVDAQENQLIEECAELIVAVNHFKRGRVPINKVAEEMADVRIMINQFCTMDNINELVNQHEHAKLRRLEERLRACIHQQ